jgi:hypothetical protein
MGATIRALAGLSPRTLALMHGPSFAGDGGSALRALADDYDRRAQNSRLAADTARPPEPGAPPTAARRTSDSFH